MHKTDQKYIRISSSSTYRIQLQNLDRMRAAASRLGSQKYQEASDEFTTLSLQYYPPPPELNITQVDISKTMSSRRSPLSSC